MKPDADDLSAVIGEASEKTKTSNGVTAAGKKDQVNIRINNRSTGGRTAATLENVDKISRKQTEIVLTHNQHDHFAWSSLRSQSSSHNTWVMKRSLLFD